MSAPVPPVEYEKPATLQIVMPICALGPLQRFLLKVLDISGVPRRTMSTFNQATGFPRRAYVSLGSNVGNRIANVEHACRLLDQTGVIRVTRTSGLYETKAMYMTPDTSDFMNGACEIQTSLSPLELLDKLEEVERGMGRDKKWEKKPRTIDLDILLYDGQLVDHERLSIPHKGMLERDFVLRPLCDIIPHNSHPRSGRTIRQHLTSLPLNPSPHANDILTPQVPLAPDVPSLKPLRPTRRTRLMSILNMTPDSFSDGGLHHIASPGDTSYLDSIKSTILSHIASGAQILDIGGQSTRPDATQVGPDEELARVLPIVKLMKSLPEASQTAISVDTFHSSVARAAVSAGANIINDVSAGTMDSLMLPTVAKLGCTVVLMHMRGTPETMKHLNRYPRGVVQSVGEELLARVRAAEDAGIRRWRIILDPGIGFAKTQSQNLELLRRFAELRAFPGLEGMPWLVGTSRKGFIGRITRVDDPKERGYGTAAAVTAAIQGGGDIVRVHDVREMRDVVRVGDAIWRVDTRRDTPIEADQVDANGARA